MNPLGRVMYWLFSGLLVLAWVNAIAYLFDPARVPRNFGALDGQPTVGDVLLHMGLISVMLFTYFMLTLGWIVIGLNQRWQPQMRGATMPEPGSLKVAVITTYVPGSEPIHMLAQTLQAMLDIVYKHDVWLLDEGDDPAARRLCEQMGVFYFTRKGRPEYNLLDSPFTPRSKGGNHNAWYHSAGHEYDIVAQMDTDFIPRTDFLTKTLPHFTDPKIAFVGTPQIYGNMKNFVARGAAQMTLLFYGPFLRGLSKINTTLMIGANHVVRVEALRQVGYYNPHLTEDLATGIAMHSAGWKSKYVPEALAIGEGPDTWSAFFKQQFRWAKGCNDLLFTRTFRAVRGMRPVQSVLYIWLQLFYLSGLAYALGLLLLGLYFGFGWSAANIELVPLLIAYVPLIVAFELAMLWAQTLNIRPKEERGFYFAGRVLMIAVMPVFMVAFFSALKDRNKHTVFEVTPKGGIASPAAVEVMRDPEAVAVLVVKKRRKRGPYRPHLLVATYAIMVLVLGVYTGRLETTYVAWAVIALGSALAILIPPTLPFIKTLPAEINEELRLMIEHAEEWAAEKLSHVPPLEALPDRVKELTGSIPTSNRAPVTVRPD